jgi:hypothetical protein
MIRALLLWLVKVGRLRRVAGEGPAGSGSHACRLDRRHRGRRVAALAYAGVMMDIRRGGTRGILQKPASGEPPADG